MTKFEIITFKECKRLSNSFEIFYGFHSTFFGKVMIGVTTEGICHLSFVDGSKALAIEVLEKEWPQARLKEDIYNTKGIIRSIFEKDDKISEKPFNLFVKGTNFQIKVWQALILIPKGTTMSYENVAYMIGNSKAVRATANAIAKNHISYLIPCHRVICKSGKIHKYRWGLERKKAILAHEAT